MPKKNDKQPATRIGYGFDSHEFRPGVPLKIGGVALAPRLALRLSGAALAGGRDFTVAAMPDPRRRSRKTDLYSFSVANAINPPAAASTAPTIAAAWNAPIT